MTHPLLPQLLNGLGAPLGATSNFTCGYAKSFSAYVCSPQTAVAKAVVISEQKAADAVLGKLPLFITWKDQGKVVTVRTNPIGTSKAGYDGVVGPFTASMVQLALLGAIELENQAGELEKVSDVLLSAAKETDEQLRVQKIANSAGAISTFLQDVYGRFDTLLAAAQARAAAQQSPLPIVLQPLPVERSEGLTTPAVAVPPQLSTSIKKAKKSRAWLWWTLGILAVAGTTGGIIYAKKRKKKPRHERTERFRRPYYARSYRAAA